MTTDPVPQQEVAERVLSYIGHQAAKGQEGIREAIQKGHEQLVVVLDGLSDEQAAFKPGPGDWSIMQVLEHAVPAKHGVAMNCVALARGEAPAAARVAGQRGGGLASVADARAGLEEGHRELLAFVDAISPQTNTEARHPHPFFGRLNCLEWAVFQRVHDGDHAGQIEQIKAAPGYPS